MATIRLAGHGLDIPAFQPRVPQFAMPEALPVNTAGASGILADSARQQGHSLIMAQVANSVAELPSLINKAYMTGQVQGIKQNALSAGDLSDIKFGPDDSFSYSPKSEYDTAKEKATLENLQAEAELRKERAKHLANPPKSVNPMFPSETPQPGGDYVDWIKNLEGKNLTAHNDSGQTSIGYGTKGKPGEVIDDAEAERRLSSELSQHQKRIEDFQSEYGVELTQPQKEALTSFDFNTGAADKVFGAAVGEDGTLDPNIAKAKMAQYIHSDASAKDGLLRNRRAQEIAWFDKADPTQQAAEVTGKMGGKIIYNDGSVAREQLPDGSIIIHSSRAANGKPIEIIKPPKETNEHYTVGANDLVEATGLTPNKGETNQDFIARARAELLASGGILPKEEVKFNRWANSVKTNPVVTAYLTARKQADGIRAAMSDPTGNNINPPEALAIVDGYVKAMRGGMATQGTTQILSEARPYLDRLEAFKNKFSSSPDKNSLITASDARQSVKVVDDVEKIASRHVEEAKKADINTHHEWSAERTESEYDKYIPRNPSSAAASPASSSGNKIRVKMSDGRILEGPAEKLQSLMAIDTGATVVP